VLVSPLHQATIAAAVSSGGWRAPVLIEGEGDLERLRLDTDVADPLDDFMRLVVTSGTGRNADVAGRAVRGKTGSAEFDTGEGIGTHAWFVGFSGDLAFAVVVEGGGGGGSVAAPIAARFLESIG